MKKLFNSLLLFLAISVNIYGDIPVVLTPIGGGPWKRDTVKYYPHKPLKTQATTLNEILCRIDGNLLILTSGQDKYSTTVMIYGFPSGVRYNSVIDLIAGEPYSIDIDYPAGIYTIRLTLADGTVLEGNFVINREQ